MTTSDLVIRTDNAGVATLKLNRPGAYNALSLAMMNSIIEHLKTLDQDKDVRCVIIEGSGKGFCAGHDLNEMRDNDNDEFRQKTFATCSTMMLALSQLRQPIIAKIHGIATAAGCQLVASCDLAIAAETARFATPGVNIGLFCSTPMVALSRAVQSKHAMHMLLTGEMVSAGNAENMGLINQAVADELLDLTTTNLAQKIASKSGRVLATGKSAFYTQREMTVSQAYDYCSQVMVENMNYADAGEGIEAFVEKRQPQWSHD